MALVKSVGGRGMTAAVGEDAARMVLLGRAVEWLAGGAAAGAPDTAAAAYLQVRAVL
jgi:hypothetical protein